MLEKYGSVARLRAPLGGRMLFVHDPLALYHISVKDQDVFQETTWFHRLNDRLFGRGLFATHGQHHRKQRKMLNPVFSIAHLRQMMPIFYKVTHKLREAIEARIGETVTEVDVVGWMGRTALELMGQAGLGYSFDPLIEERADKYGEAIKALMPALASVGPFVVTLPLCEKIFPEAWLRPLANIVPIKGVKELARIAETMHQASTEVFEKKKQALLQGEEAIKQQVGEGKDIMSVLLKANMASKEEDKLPEDELIGQMSTLTFAAMDTTSNALSATLLRLAQNLDVQDKVRREILDAIDTSGGTDVGYDDLVSLPYLDAICRETLRVHVPAPLRFREATQDIFLPLSEPVRGIDGKMIEAIHVPKGTTVFASISSTNVNPEIWGPDAHEWKPERWLSPLPSSVQDAKIPGVYSNLMTFWAGGRSCIGFKFSQLEMKVVLAVLLSNFTFELSEKPIYWNLAGVIYPSTSPGGETAEMPMKVKLFKRSAAE